VKRKKTSTPNYIRIAESFIQNTLLIKNWNQSLLDAGVCSLKDLQELPSLNQVSAHVEINDCRNTEDGTFHRAQSYARATLSRLKAAERVEQLMRFHLFCFLSYCIVLRKLKFIPVEEVLYVMRMIFEKDHNDWYLNQIPKRLTSVHKSVVMGLLASG
jgi:hypothetical protein